MSRPRAADDFQAIRARLEELRRERGAEPAPDDRRWPDGPRPYAVGSGSVRSQSPGLPPIMRRVPPTSGPAAIAGEQLSSWSYRASPRGAQCARQAPRPIGRARQGGETAAATK